MTFEELKTLSFQKVIIHLPEHGVNELKGMLSNLINEKMKNISFKELNKVML